MNKAIRAVLPQEIHRDLKHLAVDQGSTMSELLVDAVILLLRYHQRGHGLPEPLPPVEPGKDTSDEGGAK